ncbi:MAG: hypothetical protein ACOC8F_06510 [Planctomycetota bacterium]
MSYAMEPPRISVVIPAWNRCEVLDGTLARLAGQSLGPGNTSRSWW